MLRCVDICKTSALLAISSELKTSEVDVSLEKCIVSKIIEPPLVVY